MTTKKTINLKIEYLPIKIVFVIFGLRYGSDSFIIYSHFVLPVLLFFHAAASYPRHMLRQKCS